MELKGDHPILFPLKSNFENLINGTISAYEEHLMFGDICFLQRGKYLKENGVVRIFNVDISQQKRNEEIIREKKS